MGDILLRKHCFREHRLPEGPPILLLGNLLSYRQMENQSLRDAGEGTHSFQIQAGEQITLSNDAFRMLGSSGGFDNVTYVGAANYRPDLQEWTVSGGVAFDVNVANCWVLCLTTNPLSNGAVGGEYNSEWTIKESDIPAFANEICAHLDQSVRMAHIDPREYDLIGLSDFQKLKYRVRWGYVDYKDRITLLNSGASFQYMDLINVHMKSYFIKPQTFSHEREFRIIIEPFIENGQVSVSKKPLFMQLGKSPDYVR